MPIEFFQITAAYSNAMLVAIMPHISDFAKKLDLPTPQPVAIAQIERFVCFPRSDHVGGRVILTNGCEFIFDNGRVQTFVSPRSFFYLQDPRLVSKFYGQINITEIQALKIAHDAIKKLGYTDAMLSADRQPQIDPPQKDKNSLIARYHIRWRDPTRGYDPNNPPPSIEFEVDASTGQIQMLNIFNPNTYRPDLKLDVLPLVIGNEPPSTPIGPGRIVTPVTPTYAQAFLTAILPQLGDYVKKAGFQTKVPSSTNDVDMARYLTKYNCGIVEGDPRAIVEMKTSDRFIYSHGQVIAFYSADAMWSPDKEHPATYQEIDQERAKFFGPVNITTNEAVTLVRQTLRQLGYSGTVLRTDEPPRINAPGWWGTNRIARCFIVWGQTINGPTYVNAEVDVAKKTIKSLYINDHANTEIWRKPPDVGIPLSTMPLEDQSPPQPPPVNEMPKPPASLPPSMPLPVH